MRLRHTTALVILSSLAVGGSAATNRHTVRTSTPTYMVKTGDTLERVARRHGVTVRSLAEANRITNVHLIRTGQRLAIPAPGATGAKPLSVQPIAATKSAPGPMPAPLSTKVVVVSGAAPKTHTVAAGDTLSEVAAAFGTSAAALAKANRIQVGAVLRIGTRLEVPGSGAGWRCPVQGPSRFSDTWGAPRSGGRKHMGTDVMAARGAPVVAPVAGRVRTANGPIGGLAFYLAGDDGHTYYGAHLDQLVVGTGARVAAGDQIGTVGDTGNAKGGPAHLHFEIDLNGAEAVNPTPTLRQWC